MRFLIFLLIISVSICACFANAAEQINSLEPAEESAQLNSLLDVDAGVSVSPENETPRITRQFFGFPFFGGGGFGGRPFYGGFGGRPFYGGFGRRPFYGGFGRRPFNGGFGGRRIIRRRHFGFYG